CHRYKIAPTARFAVVFRVSLRYLLQILGLNKHLLSNTFLTVKKEPAYALTYKRENSHTLYYLTSIIDTQPSLFYAALIEKGSL
ncbi:MAG: hypothetical protein KAR43_08305, partial [Deltaproteobacteria bacterium]|nr:hypothetical protein [Deltaproteobacteria bacterium]